MIWLEIFLVKFGSFHTVKIKSNYVSSFNKCLECNADKKDVKFKNKTNYFPRGILTGTPLTKTVAESLAVGFCCCVLAWLSNCCRVCKALAAAADFVASLLLLPLLLLAQVPERLHAGAGAAPLSCPAKSILTSDCTFASINK